MLCHFCSMTAVKLAAIRLLYRPLSGFLERTVGDVIVLAPDDHRQEQP